MSYLVPTVLEKSQFGERAFDIYSRLLKERIIFLAGAIDEDVANIEAEKGEYIVKPGLTGLYKVTGKTHAEGGTPLYAEGGSFIFSNDPKLSINMAEREGFGFKGGQSSARSKNTPAKVLSKEKIVRIFRPEVWAAELNTSKCYRGAWGRVF